MKLSERWLREWAEPGVESAVLAHQLTMAGITVESVTPAFQGGLEGIIVGLVVECFPHPNADRLTVCDVKDGKGTRRIICGAPNVVKGMRAPLALPGTIMPGGMRIEMREVRGILSDGMLCSEAELGLSEEASGLMSLPEDAEPGTTMTELLDADDDILEFDLTPNRGDCLSVLGVAREIAAINHLDAPDLSARVGEVKAAIKDQAEVTIDDLHDCPVYFGRIVRGVDTTRRSPLWMQERLRRAGIRPINAVVDVTAYVMLELGQPLHAFDLAQLTLPVRVRRGAEGERLELLDGSGIELDDSHLVIADSKGPVALAGVMGGRASAVGELTRDVFIESANFDALTVSATARGLGLHTEASHRYERGVDPALAGFAIQRATALLVELAGGQPGPVTTAGNPESVSSRNRPVMLRHHRIGRLLGVDIDETEVGAILGRLGMRAQKDLDGWRVTPPSHRHDIMIEADLIEEVARLYGFERILPRNAAMPAVLHAAPERRVTERRIRETLVQRGYQEVITYSFVDPALQGALNLGTGARDLLNPISSELGQMRTSLWPGLVATLAYNLNRQQSRIRIFETGLTFREQEGGLVQEKALGALIHGERYNEQWAQARTKADFYDIKGDLEAVLALGGCAGEFRFEAAEHPSLHPGQSARILRGERPVGWIGVLHPAMAGTLDLPHGILLFEVDLGIISSGALPSPAAVSRFPALRRDLSLTVPEALPVAELLDRVQSGAPEWLQSVQLFDIYRGQGIEEGLKSIALGLILQDSSRTLTDEEVDSTLQRLVQDLAESLGAIRRE